MYEDLKRNYSFPLENTHSNTVFINEPVQYSLIMNSQMPLAGKFQEWLSKEVLPSIRKYGEYKIKEKYISEISKLTSSRVAGDLIKQSHKHTQQFY